MSVYASPYGSIYGSVTKRWSKRYGSSNLLPPGYIFRTKADGIDTIGVSASDYLSIRSELRSIFFSDATTKRDDATIIANIQASEYLNCGWELTGNATDGYALYEEGTALSILLRAYNYFDETYPAPATVFPYTFPFTL